MINHDILPREKYMLSCRVVENYDVLKTVAAVFDQYPVAELRKSFWMMFKWALLDRDDHSKRDAIGNIICLYENVDYAIIGLSTIELADQETKANVKSITAFEPYELRSVLWLMFQSAICENTMGQTEEDRKELICTYEAVSDLAAAAYILAKEY